MYSLLHVGRVSGQLTAAQSNATALNKHIAELKEELAVRESDLRLLRDKALKAKQDQKDMLDQKAEQLASLERLAVNSFDGQIVA